ncbi:ribonucleotide-diphosphate reductase [Kyrpidia spormannii]|uniref:R2-like ligand binding oxidase n=1 Tax=Kyrpidia spormannii TaxID=2055160 RepID=A0A2K8N7R2_9BACL|nr:ribonucleotide-diphosphate reductase [Kyrpidia spormannii]
MTPRKPTDCSIARKRGKWSCAWRNTNSGGWIVRVYQTTSENGLNHALLPMRLYHKAKRLGTWDPKEIDFTQDIEDWQTLDEREQETVLRLCSLFQAGEEAVTRDLLPLIQVIAEEGRLEEEMFLTTFLFEEAKHTELFRRVLDEVIGAKGDLAGWHQENYRKIFYEFLPEAMNRLKEDPSPEAQAEASVTYNMVVEGVLAETGYYSFFNGLGRVGKMPGLIKAVHLLRQDESRHIGYGTYLLSRLVAEHEQIWEVINRRMGILLPYAIGVVNDTYEGQEEPYPFGMTQEETVEFSTRQFQTRMEVLERARGRSVEEIFALSETVVGVEG